MARLGVVEKSTGKIVNVIMADINDDVGPDYFLTALGCEKSDTLVDGVIVKELRPVSPPGPVLTRSEKFDRAILGMATDDFVAELKARLA